MTASVIKAGTAASMVVVIGIVLLINADVVARGLFDTPLRGVTELVALAIPAMVFTCVPDLLCRKELISAGLLSRWLNTAASAYRHAFDCSFHLVTGFISVAILMATMPWMIRAWHDNEFVGVEGDFVVPLWPARIAVVFGCGLLALLSAGIVVRSARRFLAEFRLPACFPFLILLAPAAFVLVDGRAAYGGLSIALMFLLLYAGLPVAFALMASSFVGITFIKGAADTAAGALAMAATGALSSYVFAAVPMFVLMGFIVARADIGRDSLEAAHALLRRVIGGFGVATVAANAIFAAITGISIASAAIFSKIAVPPLIAQGFTPRFAVGLVAGSSVLGMLIPPSLLLIIYGLVAEVSINQLFIAAIIPGLLLTSLFAIGVVAAAFFNMPFAVRQRLETQVENAESGHKIWTKMAPITVLVVAVLGGIYSGMFTPTEAGGVGALLALVLGFALRRLDAGDLIRLTCDATRTSASILFLILAASAFGMMLTLSGIPATIGNYVAATSIGLAGYVVLYLGLLIVLGMVLDSTSILLIMVPLALPTVAGLGGDLVWFGIVTVIGVEIGLLTPPLGLSAFAIKSALDDQSISLNDIFVGALPFSVVMLLLTLLLVAFPEITTALL